MRAMSAVTMKDVEDMLRGEGLEVERHYHAESDRHLLLIHARQEVLDIAMFRRKMLIWIRGGVVTEEPTFPPGPDPYKMHVCDKLTCLAHILEYELQLASSPAVESMVPLHHRRCYLYDQISLVAARED